MRFTRGSEQFIPRQCVLIGLFYQISWGDYMIDFIMSDVSQWLLFFAPTETASGTIAMHFNMIVDMIDVQFLINM